MTGLLALHLALAVLLVGSSVRAATPAPRLEGPALLDALRAGGYVLLFRHAATDYTQDDVDRYNLDNCATQRNLSEYGRQQSVAIGQAFERLQIPVGTVLASPYCRTLETARLAFGNAEPSSDLISELSDDSTGSRERLTAALQALLASPPDPGSNTILVTHTLNIQDVVGLDIEEAEAVIASPDGAGGFTIVGRVQAEGWEQLDANGEAAATPAAASP